MHTGNLNSKASKISLLATILVSTTLLVKAVTTPALATGSGTGAVCPPGNVKYNIDTGYEYNDGSGTISGNSSSVTVAVNSGYVLTMGCLKIGGSEGGSTIYFPNVGSYGPYAHGISHVVLLTGRSTPTPGPGTPTPDPHTTPTPHPGTPTPNPGTPTPDPEGTPTPSAPAFPTPTPNLDVCPNLDGVQASVPSDYHKDAAGINCVQFQLGGPPSDGGRGGAVLGTSTQGQVLGATTMAGAGSFTENLYLALASIGALITLKGSLNFRKAFKKA